MPKRKEYHEKNVAGSLLKSLPRPLLYCTPAAALGNHHLSLLLNLPHLTATAARKARPARRQAS